MHLPTPRHGNVYGGPANERNLRSALGVYLVHCPNSAARAVARGAAPGGMQAQIVPNPRYVEWMMGFPADWTRVDAGPAEPEPDDDAVAEEHEPRPAPKRGPRRARAQAGPGAVEAVAAVAAVEAVEAVAAEPAAAVPPAEEARARKTNGMHLLMSEQRLGVRAASVAWRAMGATERASFSDRARAQRTAAG